VIARQVAERIVRNAILQFGIRAIPNAIAAIPAMGPALRSTPR
jgi:hypothetical protein